MTTSDEASVLRNLGFVKHSSAQPWRPGDVLIRTGHTEMAFDSNHTMGAHSAKVALENQVSINTNPTSASDWNELWRYESGAKTEWIKGNRYLGTGEMQNNAQIIFTTLLGFGWTVEAIAGAMGNFQKESTVNPGIWQNLNPNNPALGWGLAQWTPSTNYTDWAAANGYAPDDGDKQLIWIDTLSNVDQYYPTDDYPETWEEYIHSTKEPEYLAYAWMNNWERPKDRNQPERKEYARYWYEWWLGEYIPPPNPPFDGDWKKSMPIWMCTRRI